MDHDWIHNLVEAVGVATPIIIYLSVSKRKAKSENDKRHAQNQAKLNYLVVERMFLKPHFHQETEGALTAEGIVKRENGGIPSA